MWTFFGAFSEAIKQVIQTNYHAIHEENLDLITPSARHGNLLPRYHREAAGESFAERSQRTSESFLRDLIARTFGPAVLRSFHRSILTTLAAQSGHLSAENLDLLLSYDRKRRFPWSAYRIPRRMTSSPGNKGYNLTKLNSLGIKVLPPLSSQRSISAVEVS